MKQTTVKQLLVLSLIAYGFPACIKHDIVNSNNELKEIKKSIKQANIAEDKMNKPPYGLHTNEIKEFLSATPLGAEIYLEQKESGEWYLKVEKTFTAQKNEGEIEITKPIYGESILI